MYATLDDLIALWGPEEAVLLATRGNSRDSHTMADADVAVLEEAVRYASSEIDSYLGGRYSVPLAVPIPHVVTATAADIARYRLTGGDVDEKDPVLGRYRSALAWLRDIASGTASLPGAQSGTVQAGGVDMHSGYRVWGGTQAQEHAPCPD